MKWGTRRATSTGPTSTGKPASWTNGSISCSCGRTRTSVVGANGSGTTGAAMAISYCPRNGSGWTARNGPTKTWRCSSSWTIGYLRRPTRYLPIWYGSKPGSLIPALPSRPVLRTAPPPNLPPPSLPKGRSDKASMSTAIPSPEHVALDHPEKGELTVFWNDGSARKYALADLRKACPCATCRDLRDQLSSAGGLTLLANESLDPCVEVVDMSTVGRYALQFTWKDGHNTGIYTYEYLYGSGQDLDGAG
ncbi:MAG: DUF971 domain-containing protein [Gemmatimonadetes bacterium]|nr:DUF971 domain-containing protein [Gemmatimonadota bacterium]